MDFPTLKSPAERLPVSGAASSEAAFARVTGLAARLLGAPVALVSVYAEEKRRPQACVGAGAELLHDELLPYIALLDGDEKEVVAVEDLGADSRFADAGAGTETHPPMLRFFAAAGVKTPDGVCRGHLCLLDAEPRQFSEADRRTLADLAAVLGDEFALRAAAPSPNGKTNGECALPPLPRFLAAAPQEEEIAETEGDPALEQRVRELTELNGSLLAELRGRSEDELGRVRLEQLIEESADFIGLAHLDGKTFAVNAVGRKLVGLDSLAEAQRLRLLDYLLREDRSFFLGTVTPTLMREGRWEGDFRFRHFKTNAAIEVSWTLFLLKDPRTGEPLGIATVARDITERKKSEAALRESEARFRHLVEQAGESFFVYNLQGRLIDVNQEACNSLGYKRAELLELSVQDLEPDFDPVRGRERWKQMVPGVAVTMKGAQRRKDGSVFPYEARVSAFRSGGQRLMLALSRDITDRHRAELASRQAHGQLEARVNDRTTELGRANEELRSALRQNNLLAAAIESCQMGVLICDPNQPDAPTIFSNNAFTNITGYSRAETIGRNCRFLQGPATDPAIIKQIREAVEARRSFRGTLLNYRKDGSTFWNELTINPVFDEVGRLVNFVGFQADVTPQVKAQEALRESEKRFAQMTANVPGMVYQLLLHPDGTALFPYVSEGCRELFGMEPAQMEPDACTLLDLIHEEDIGEFLRTLNLSKETQTPWSWEGRYAVPGGDTRYLQGAARPEKHGETDTLWDGLLLDITERKRAEQEIRDRARQAAAVAELGQRALAGEDHAALAREAAEVVVRTLGVELSTVSELMPGGEELVIRASAGFQQDLTGARLKTQTGSLAGYAIECNGPLIAEDLRCETRFEAPPEMLERGAISALSVVIRGKDQPLGALCTATSRPRKYAPEDISFLQSVANVLATAMDRFRDEQALRKSEARNAAILETALDSIVTIDHQDRIVEFNPAAEKTFGIPRAEALGRAFTELVPPVPEDDSDEARRKSLRGLAKKPAAEGRPALGQRVELPARRADGTQILVELAITRIPVEGRPLFTAHLRDVTARRRDEERLRLLESATVSAHDAVLIAESSPIDLPGPRILYANKAFERMTGYTAAEISAHTPRILQGPKSDRATLDKIRQALADWKPVQAELVNYRKDGSEFWVELSIVPVANEVGWFTHWVSVQRDITERKRTELALNHAKEEAQRANSAKSEFLSRMSHELRTPLNAILGFGQLLQMQKLSQAQNDRVGHIVNAGRHLLDLINEVLDIARIEAGRVELSLEPVRVADIVGETLDLIKPLASQRQIVVAPVGAGDPVGEMHVMADRQRFKQVLLNLISNAIKYNSEGGSVRLEYHEEADRRLRICISDTGPGIPAEKMDRLFIAFDRLGAETSQVQGTGLGLALSKRLMEAMDGAIGLQSVYGQGTTFWVELPRVESQMDRRTRLSLSGPPTRMPVLTGTRNVLYIEDNLSNLTLIEHLLADHTEIKLMTAMQGRLGFDLARQHRPDLILLDLHLPDIPGWEVLASLKGDAATKSIPVVAVSADATPRQIAKLLQAGAHAYLTKPLEVDRFHAVLRQILEPKLLPQSQL